MITTSSIIECINPTCTAPINAVGNKECAACQTPLVYRYLWATGQEASKIASGETIAHRYEVVSPQIWRDIKPKELPLCSEKLPTEVSAYAKCYSQYLHIPRVYDCITEKTASPILLLEAPIDDSGIYPTIFDAYRTATGVRQVYWLWQILELWQPLSKLGMHGSLLLPDNLRVSGWCVRLVELIEAPASLQQLGECWQPLIYTAQSNVSEQLKSIVRLLTLASSEDIQNIQKQLNHLLLSAASELPLYFKVAGATFAGAQLKHNEDACFPNSTENGTDDEKLGRVSIICDGIGGHEGGEVASQLAIQSLKLQARALLTEVAFSNEPVPPDLLLSQLEASLRVVNNLICNANNEQNRSGTQRMGTTLVIALQVPQAIQTPMGWDAENSHELYIASIGDSRAYWITRDGCQLLTLDDDIATREARNGRMLYRKALTRADAGALTQALGTKEAQYLHFHGKRFIIEEDGLLILCSDGFSDNNLVERTWRTEALPILDGHRTILEGVAAWINIANQINGHDNISLVINYCRVSPDYLAATSPYPLHLDTFIDESETDANVDTDNNVISVESVTIASNQLDSPAPLDLELSPEPTLEAPSTPPIKTTPTKKRGKTFVLLIGLMLLLIGCVSLGLFVWWRYNPRSFNSLCRQLPTSLQRACPTRR